MPQDTVQPNLVTKDGQLGRELDRMRILIARVSGRLEVLPAGNDYHEDSELAHDVPSEDEKVKNIINGI
jgi:hypothetical protein